MCRMMVRRRRYRDTQGSKRRLTGGVEKAVAMLGLVGLMRFSVRG